jgi:hypothetical protein
MDVFTEEEVRVFCKRTKQIEDLEKRLRDELKKKAEARVRAAAKRGELLDYEETYAAEKAKLGSEYREAKNQAKLQGAALEADWGSQLAPGRWNAITPEASKVGHSIGFLDPETAQVQAVHHAFEQHSTIRETAMMTELLKWGIGVIGGCIGRPWNPTTSLVTPSSHLVRPETGSFSFSFWVFFNGRRLARRSS